MSQGNALVKKGMVIGTHEYNSFTGQKFINVFKCVWQENKDEVINANANISDWSSGINTDWKSVNLLDENESRASSMSFEVNKPEISL